MLAWALSESYQEPLANVFCESLLGKLRPENPVLWMTDAQGVELSGGLAISLRDYARFGMVLINARTSRLNEKIPAWWLATLTASSGARRANLADLEGLSKGSESRYGFVHLGGAPNRAAIIGPYGNSLYVDFDRRLVIAIFASYPRERTPAMLAVLESVWSGLATASRPAAKR